MYPDTQIKMPQEVCHILKTLRCAGYGAYVVGGCVRDSLLGKTPDDWDIATEALPQNVKGLFGMTADTGIKHGTVTVLLGGGRYEVTTFRIDGLYEDGRHPVSVGFTSSIEDDLSRRDFTINAIAFSEEEGFIDPFNGIEDINNKTIRAVGNAGDRFREDALRMLRAVRFSAQLDFQIDEDTMRSISENCHLIARISSERVNDELTKILVSEHPRRFVLLKYTGLLHHIIPELEPCFEMPLGNVPCSRTIGEHMLQAVSAIKQDRILRWAMLMHDIGQPLLRSASDESGDSACSHPEKGAKLARAILKRLKFDNKSIERICRLIKHHEYCMRPDGVSVRRAMAVIGDDIFEDLLEMMQADKSCECLEHKDEALDLIRKIRSIYNSVRSRCQCTKLKDMAVSGDDLLKMGFLPGRNIGYILARLFDLVIENPEMNSRDKLLEAAEKLLEADKLKQ